MRRPLTAAHQGRARRVGRRLGRISGAFALSRPELLLLLGPIVVTAGGGWSPSLAAQPAAGETTAPAPAPGSAASQEADDSGETVSELDVVAQRDYAHLPGAVIGTITPEIQYSPAQIQALGVNTVEDLLVEIAPQTRSDRTPGGEAPVVLLNGRRISSLNEVVNLPTEAILRVDILPEEAALQYGYPASQRVVNIVLRRNFRAAVAGLEGGGSDGGRTVGQAELNGLRVHRDARFHLDLKYKGATDVTDADRGIVEPPSSAPFDLAGNVVSPVRGGEIDPALSALVGEPVTVAGTPAIAAVGAPTLADFVPTAGKPNTTDIGRFRTLAPATQSLTANAVYARPLFEGINATFNASLGGRTSTSRHGLPSLKLLVPAGDPFSPFASDVVVDRFVPAVLHQEVDTWTAHLGSVLNKETRNWRFSLSGVLDHTDIQTDTDSGVDSGPLQALLSARSANFNPFGPFPTGLVVFRAPLSARSISDSAGVHFLAAGSLATLPAGDLRLSVKLGDAQDWLRSKTPTPLLAPSMRSRRNDGSARLNIDLPIANREKQHLAVVGGLSVNANASFDHLSDLGDLRSLGYGVNWTPARGYNLIASYSDEQIAPLIEQLGAAAVLTPAVRVFDFSRGQSAEVARISGGNPALRVEKRRVVKVGLTIRPLVSQNLALTADYLNTDIRNPIIVIPAATAAFEAAFPGSFLRDATGALVQEDERPVNLGRWRRSQIRWGINYSHHFTGSAASTRSALPSSALPAGNPDSSLAAGQASSRRFKSMSSGSGGGRIEFALYHTLVLTDRQELRPGGPTLDLLRGGPASFAGGQYRNEIEAQLGLSRHGLGARLVVDWRQHTTILGGAGSPTGDLHFSDLTTANLRLFDNLGQQPAIVQRYPWLSGSRISLNITNLLDQHISVRDRLGATPLVYQAGYLDPFGRTITLSFRKLFR